MADIVEIYTCKLERQCQLDTASINVVLSATRGSVEDVNRAMQRAVDIFREAFPPVKSK